MSKELPYFKFEPSEWQNGDIQMCDYETQVKFLDICCAYWSRLGILPYAYVMQKLCGGNANALKTLEKYGIIKVESDLISINFLDRQLEELQAKSQKAKESAEKRWKANKNDANASETQSERNAKRREENRIEKKKKEKVFNFKDSFIELGVDEQYLTDWLEVRKKKGGLNTKTALDAFIKSVESSTLTINEAVKLCAEKSWVGFNPEWIQPKQPNLFNQPKSNHVYHDPPEQDREARRIKNQLFLHTDKVRKDYILGFNYTEEQLQDYLEANIKGYKRP